MTGPNSSSVTKSLLKGLFLVVFVSLTVSTGSVLAQDLGSLGKPSAGSKGSGRSSGSKGSGRTSGSKTSGSSKKRTPPRKKEDTTNPSSGTSSRQGLKCATQKAGSDADRRSAFDKALAEGRDFFSKRDYRRAEASFKNAVSYQCDSRTYLELGSVYKAEQRWGLAEESFRSAIKVEPSNVDALVALSNTMTRLLFASEVGGRYAEAETLARRAVFLSPSSAAANQQLGEALESLGRISRETQAYYEQATRLAPKSASAFAHLGRILRKNGKIKESAKALSTALTLATDVESKIDVAEVLQTLQQFGESEKLLTEALTQDEANPLGLQLLARALMRQQKNEEAETVLKKAASAGSQSIVPWLSLGSFYLQQQKLEDSEKAFVNAAALAMAGEKRSISRQLEILGDAYKRAGRTADADRVVKMSQVLQAGRTIANS